MEEKRLNFVNVIIGVFLIGLLLWLYSTSYNRAFNKCVESGNSTNYCQNGLR